MLASIALGLAACADATGEVRGGDLAFDPVPPPAAQPNACPAVDTTDAGSGTTWTDLYRDLFGPTGAAKCASTTCHGSAGTSAARIGVLCVDQQGCRQSLLDRGWIKLPADSEAPEQSAFYTVLRRCDAQQATVGVMPLLPTSYRFSEHSLERITAWLREGAKDD